MIDLQPHDIEVHLVTEATGRLHVTVAREYEDFIRHARPAFLHGAPLGSGSWYRARFKDEPGIEGIGPTERQAIDDLYEVRKWVREGGQESGQGGGRPSFQLHAPLGGPDRRRDQDGVAGQRQPCYLARC